MEQRVTDTLEQAFQAVVAIERYLRPQTNRRYESRSGEGRYDKVTKSEIVSKTPTSINNSMQGGPQNKDLKGKGVSVGTSKARENQFCYRCHSKGHFAAECPTRNLVVQAEEDPEGSDVEEYIPPEDEEISEDELETGDRVAFTRFVPYTPEDTASSNVRLESPRASEFPNVLVVHCVLSQTREEDDWRRYTIFHTNVKCGEKTCKLIVDGGSCMNVVSASTVSRLGLTPEAHPKPFKILRVDKSSIPVTHRCLVPIGFSSYKDMLWCDVIPMEVGNVLLGRPWLYDLDVTQRGRANTCTFQFDGKTIRLKPLPPKTHTSVKDKTEDKDQSLGSVLRIIGRKELEKECRSASVVYVVVYREAKEPSPESKLQIP